MSETFPVMLREEDRKAERKGATFRRSVPWNMVRDHRSQVRANHYQEIERLRERGGLAADELVAVLEGRRWRQMGPEAWARLEELVTQWERKEEALRVALAKDYP